MVCLKESVVVCKLRTCSQILAHVPQEASRAGGPQGREKQGPASVTPVTGVSRTGLHLLTCGAKEAESAVQVPSGGLRNARPPAYRSAQRDLSDIMRTRTNTDGAHSKPGQAPSAFNLSTARSQLCPVPRPHSCSAGPDRCSDVSSSPGR